MSDLVGWPRPSYWEDLTRSVTESGRQVMVLAYEGNDVLGSAYGLRDRDRSEMGRVGGMWVESAWRRRGVGRALLENVRPRWRLRYEIPDCDSRTGAYGIACASKPCNCRRDQDLDRAGAGDSAC